MFAVWLGTNIRKMVLLTNYVWETGLIYQMLYAIWYNMYNLKKREKHAWRSVTFRKVAGLTFFHEWSRFLNCADGTKSSKVLHI